MNEFYISIDQLINARKSISQNVKKADTFAGIIILLLNSVKIQDYYYKANMTGFCNQVNWAFTLKRTNDHENEKTWFALFTPNWATKILSNFLGGKRVNIYDLLATIYWNESEKEIEKLKNRLESLINGDFKIIFDTEKKVIFDEIRPLEENQLLKTLRAYYSNIKDNKKEGSEKNFTIKYDGTFIVKEAGDLSASPFSQTLYSGLEIKQIVNIFDFNIIGEFILDNDTTNTLLSPNPFQVKPTYPNVPKKAQNLLLYGVAGVGKSYTIKKITGENEAFIERIVFHPDYMNTDFVGQIAPTMKADKIAYDFKAGSFTKILKKAILDPSIHYYLVIEEINRGNAPAIFGEIFQLLDRQADGSSTYQISNEFIAKEIYGGEETDKKIHLPANLTILATMNTADQNVFTLDTAFQRRWTMRMIENNIDNCAYKDTPILDTGVTWGIFNQVLNDFILVTNKDTLSSEDKRLGAYFVREDELQTQSEDGIPFAEKVIKYLWDDVFKFNKSTLFDNTLNSLDEVLRLFKNNAGFNRFDIFNPNICTLLTQGIRSNIAPLVSEIPNEP